MRPTKIAMKNRRLLSILPDQYTTRSRRFDFIDQKGKMFGFLHVFDVFIFIVALAGIFMIVRNSFRQSPWVTIDLKVVSNQEGSSVELVPPANWLAGAIHAGDKEPDWDGSPKAEIIEKRLYDAGYDRSFVYLTVKLKTSYNKKTKTHTYKNRPVTAGTTLDFIFPQASVRGVITDNNPQQAGGYQEKIIAVELYDRRPWYADSIHVGDRTSSASAQFIEVLSKNVRPAEKSTVVTDYGRSLEDNNRLTITGRDPTRKDITLTLRINAIEDRNGFLMYRDDQRIRIGNTLWIPLPSITLSGAVITAIE